MKVCFPSLMCMLCMCGKYLRKLFVFRALALYIHFVDVIDEVIHPAGCVSGLGRPKKSEACLTFVRVRCEPFVCNAKRTSCIGVLQEKEDMPNNWLCPSTRESLGCGFP